MIWFRLKRGNIEKELKHIGFDRTYAEMQGLDLYKIKKVYEKIIKRNMEKGIVEYQGYKYWYEYKAAKDRVDICLATKDPQKYCNGFYLYSTKDPGDGKAFVVVKTNHPNQMAGIFADVI